MLDEHCYRTMFNQNLFEELVSKKKITPEVTFDLEEDEYPSIKEQIALRGWRRLASPRSKVSKWMIQEFYANAVQSDEEMGQGDQHPYKSYVRGVEVDFSPQNIKRVLRFKDNTSGAMMNSAACAAIDGAHAPEGRKSPNLKARSGISSLWT
ncbi:hypothetical protein PIB30_082384 [Stylosanthes scabra]|uniref:Putative plant transposon protein domain-containing protein n=1 Tax=Stylosanthes scabra TaxID=79078 RepID=A0ABU6STM4_9FABA|nr:hypothetical protein [Stylosanthes scabra]